jgi:hypothetical protein
LTTSPSSSIIDLSKEREVNKMEEVKGFKREGKPVAENLKKIGTLEKALVEEFFNVEYELQTALSTTNYMRARVWEMIEKGTTWEEIAEELERYTEDLIEICDTIKNKCE